MRIDWRCAMSGVRRAAMAGLVAATAATLAVAIGCSRTEGSAASSDTLASQHPGDTVKSNPADGAARAPVASRAMPVVLFAGTSLTAGLGLDPDSAYPMQIQRKIDSAGMRFEVVNAGVSGETSAGLVDRLDWLERASFDVLVLETGANDGLRGIPTATLQKNIETAIDRIKTSRPDARIVLVQMEALPNLGPKYASDFHALYGKVAKEKGVTLLPFLLTDVAGHRELNQSDGVHPNYVGERMVTANVWRGLRPVLESIGCKGAETCAH